MRPIRILLIASMLALLTLAGCVTAPSDRSRTPPPSMRHCCKNGNSSATRTEVVRSAARLVDIGAVGVSGRRVPDDCAGVARAVYLEQGIDLYADAGNDSTANGVRLIYSHVRQHGMVHYGPIPNPGDLVFFDNTWDLNGDGRLNDPLTHIGIVERIEPDGTVVFISRVTDTVERYRLNLSLPHVHKTAEGRVLNDYIRRKRTMDPEETGRLTGELFAFYGTRIGR
jgi:hypothetical protein